jgi:hypothetical protein
MGIVEEAGWGLFLKHSHTILNLETRQNSQSYVILLRFEGAVFRIWVGRIFSEITHIKWSKLWIYSLNPWLAVT